MKKLVTLLLAAVLMLVLVSCKAGVPSYDLEIDPATQKGTANFTIRVPKNDAPETGNNFDKPDNPNDPGYIKSPEALLDLFQKAVPSGYTVTMQDEPKIVENDNGDEVDQGNFAYTVSFKFSGIDDYNKKIMKLVGQASWDGANASAKAAAEAAGGKFEAIVPASLTTSKNGDKVDVVFTEDLRIIDVVSYWAYTVLTTDKTGVWKDVYKDAYPDYPVTFGNTINLDLAKYTIKFGDNTQTYKHSDGPLVTLKATVDAVAEDTSDDNGEDNSGSSESNPKTGDPSALPIVLLVIASAGGIITARKRK